MANDIGWGQPYSIENGFGMAAVNGALEGYGTVVINSYSGETDISSIDEDNRATIIDESPVLYEDAGFLYIFFNLSEGIVPQSMSVDLYAGGDLYTSVSLTTDGINLLSGSAPTTWYAVLTINIDTETSYTFTSNTIVGS